MAGVAGLEPTFTKFQRFLAHENFLEQKKWQGLQDSNLRHLVLETSALPTELNPFKSSNFILPHFPHKLPKMCYN